MMMRMCPDDSVRAVRQFPQDDFGDDEKFLAKSSPEPAKVSG